MYGVLLAQKSVYGVTLQRTRQDTTTAHLVESSATVVSSLAPLFMSHLKLTMLSLKVADGKLSERCFSWLLVVKVDDVQLRTPLWHTALNCR